MEPLTQRRIGWMEGALARLGGIARRHGMGATLPPHLAIGLEGEDEAFFFLRRKGYAVVARRWSAGNLPGDLDLIAWQEGRLCFVEVKTRTAHDTTPAEVAVDEHKRDVLRRLVRAYLRQLPQPPMQVRFDVVSVYLVPNEPREFLHFESAFAWSERRADRN